MKATRWRGACLVVGALCAVLVWRDCSRSSDERAATVECARPGEPARGAIARAVGGGAEVDERDLARAPVAQPQAGDEDGAALYGFQVPGWAMWFAPQAGEDLRVYRDRVLPLAVAAIAPQRARVARSRDSFAAAAQLDARQRAELEAAARDTASALQDRAMTAVLGGELAPATFKPMLAVALARELLEIVARGQRRFTDGLREDQRAALARHPFDFGDYLVFSTRWEDALAPL
jgi:hypothetical protein